MYRRLDYLLSDNDSLLCGRLLGRGLLGRGLLARRLRASHHFEIDLR
jgi:hypothetical protein